MGRVILAIAVLGCVTFACGTSSQAPKSTAQQPTSTQARTEEQTVFESETKIERPVPVPDDVLRILRQDKRNQTCLGKRESLDKIPASWFVASEIDLNYDQIPDLVVVAVNPCLFGANINPFWVFRKTDRGYEAALRVYALALELLKTRTNGFRDIRTSAATAVEVTTTTYTFDGRRYRPRRSRTEPIR
jgi:hypothetical protein